MKNVWLLNHYAQEPNGPGGTRHFSLAKHLHSFGWHTSIIAASTELNTGRQRLDDAETCRREQYEGVEFLWVKTPSYEGNGLGRMRNMLSYTWQVLRLPLMDQLPKPDVIVGSSVHPFAGWAGLKLAQRYRCPFVFEVRDLWPQTLIDLGRLKPCSLMAILLRALERVLYRKASRIVTLLPAIDDYLRPLGVPDSKIVWIPNGVDLYNFTWRLPVGSGGNFVLMYLGSFGNANGVDQLLDAMSVLQKRFPERRVHLRLIGDGPLKSSFHELALSRGLKNVTFEPPVPKNKISNLAAEADAFVVCLADVPLYRFGISLNKLFDYLAAGRPVVFAGRTANNPVAEARAGVTVPPCDPESFANAVISLIDMPAEERAAMGGRGRKYVEEVYSFEILAKKFADVLDAAAMEGKK
ncbi:glycosyltransferase family 4 protein [Ralstonia sp. RL]|uniref:glycosyltransferase family 4 protein n=1 Tax=Ralstonia sp. RL TaxID=1839756 RepID=UPI000A753582|nr:glycosyltransferase family 4 protein [Ralstonia sp. RL]